MDYVIIGLGKDSVKDISNLDALTKSPNTPYAVNVTCKQVPDTVVAGFYTFIYFGSDNNKGTATSWKHRVGASNLR